jgi:hypothetical protein
MARVMQKPQPKSLTALMRKEVEARRELVRVCYVPAVAVAA